MISRTLIANEDIIQSLINFRDEFAAIDEPNHNVRAVIYMLNSCLYKGYKLPEACVNENENQTI